MCSMWSAREGSNLTGVVNVKGGLLGMVSRVSVVNPRFRDGVRDGSDEQPL